MNITKGLANDKLKIIAAIAMIIDHIGAYLFPHIMLLRIIGRVAFPIFAFMIAEGCRYTKNKKKYLLTMAVFALVCQILFAPFTDQIFLRIPVTFTLSITTVYAMENLAKKWRDGTAIQKITAAAILVAVVGGIWLLTENYRVDYRFFGCLLPCWVSLVWIDAEYSGSGRQYSLEAALIMLAIGLWLVYSKTGGVQVYSFAAIPLLALYNGKRGDSVSKHFFYIFYPAHILVIFGIKHLFF